MPKQYTYWIIREYIYVYMYVVFLFSTDAVCYMIFFYLTSTPHQLYKILNLSDVLYLEHTRSVFVFSATTTWYSVYLVLGHVFFQ